MLTKICGIKRLEDVHIVNKYMPDYIGFVFSKSKRQIDITKAILLNGNLDKKIKTVGVFVNEDISFIKNIDDEIDLNVIQLHGDEDNEYIENLKKVTNAEIWKAIRVKDVSSIKYGDTLNVDKLVLDYFSESEYGGSGKLANLELIKNNRPEKDFFIAGGLNSENVQKVINEVEPIGVDVSSGVEEDGFKSEEKIKRFLENKMEVAMSGRFGIYGGRYIPETLANAVEEVNVAYKEAMQDESFLNELDDLLKNYAGRPSLLYYAKNMTKDLGGAKVYLKREDLNHTGSHKINNVLGQALLAKRMGKKRLIAETGAGQHGVATATAAALLGMDCEVFMGKEDTDRQALNVYRMKLLGTTVHSVENGTGTLKDAVSETFREWTKRIEDTYYVIGSVMGPSPFPEMVRDFQSVIGKEIKEQLLEKEGKLPYGVIACVGGGSNAMGTFYEFIKDKDVKLIGVEAAGRGVKTKETAATIGTGSVGVFHGMKSYFCQNEYGQIAPVYSISAGLDYPGIGPEHAYLYDKKRADYVSVTDDESVEAFEYLSRTEGIIPAIESAHAVYHAMKLAPKLSKEDILVITISGRGDKDVAPIARYKGEDIYE